MIEHGMLTAGELERAFDRGCDAVEARTYTVCGTAPQPHLLSHHGGSCINCGARMRGDD